MWARAGLGPKDLERTALLCLEDVEQARSVAAAVGADVAAILARADSPQTASWRKGLEALSPGRAPILGATWSVWRTCWKPPQNAALLLTHIKFDHKGPDSATTDGLNIRWSFANDLTHKGNGAGAGEWITATRHKEPALYVVNKTVTIKARFKAPIGTANAKIKATTAGQFPGVKEMVINFNPLTGISNPEYVELQLTGPIGAKIDKLEFKWRWLALEIDGQAQAQANQLFTTSGKHTAYVVLGVPLTPWYRGAKTHPWVAALDFAIVDAKTRGLQTKANAIERLTQFMWSGFGLIYDGVGGRPAYVAGGTLDLTSFMTKASGAFINCHDCNGTVWCLSNLLGVNSTLAVTRSFGYVKRGQLIGQGLVNTPIYTNYVMQNPLDTCTAGSLATHNCDDDILTDPIPHKRTPFTEHSVAVFNAAIYDACVGPHLGRAMAAYARMAIDISSARERNNAPTRPFRNGRFLIR